MLIISIKTDQPEASIALYEDYNELKSVNWLAHFKLSETIHSELEELLKVCRHSYEDLNGIVFFAGPGSFTGLRIGATVANSMAYGLGIPIVSSSKNDWIKKGVNKLLSGKYDKLALPEYGGLPHITKPRK